MCVIRNVLLSTIVVPKVTVEYWYLVIVKFVWHMLVTRRSLEHNVAIPRSLHPWLFGHVRLLRLLREFLAPLPDVVCICVQSIVVTTIFQMGTVGLLIYPRGHLRHSDCVPAKHLPVSPTTVCSVHKTPYAFFRSASNECLCLCRTNWSDFRRRRDPISLVANKMHPWIINVAAVRQLPGDHFYKFRWHEVIGYWNKQVYVRVELQRNCCAPDFSRIYSSPFYR